MPTVTLIIPTTGTLGANRFDLDYGDFDDPLDRESVFDILFTVTISDDPFADGLYLTNQLRRIWESTFLEPFTEDVIVWFQLTQPVVSIRKGVISTDYPAARGDLHARDDRTGDVRGAGQRLPGVDRCDQFDQSERPAHR